MHPTQRQQRAISLRKSLPRARFLCSSDIAVARCSADWRACRPGDVFFAVTTADDDGHEHAAEAIARGAVAIVGERLVPVSAQQILVQDSRAAFARICQALAGDPTRHLRTIGIAGSAGKTVTAMLLASVCEAAGEAAGVMSSLGHSDSLVQTPANCATPTPPEFAAWLGRMQTAGCQSAVIELPGCALAERRASGIRLDAAILTNIKSGISREYASAAAYQRVIRRVFNLLKRSGVVVINADDHRSRNLLPQIKRGALTYALHAQADITARVLERSPSEQTFLLTAGDQIAPVRTRMIGDHHVSNCLAAATAALACGYELEPIVRGLEAVERVPGRMERLECGQPFSVFVDAAASPETLALTVKTVRQVTPGRVLVVFGPHESTSAAHRALVGRVLERGSQVPIITGDEPCLVDPLKTAHDVLDGFARPHKARVIPSRHTAIRFALSHARPGDAVLIAGRGDRQTRLLDSRSPAYDDREVARAWLYDSDRSEPATTRFRVVG
jgi:UDP-N-acetylmuramoyl-L-alanyl-D-glutamate--2,6-diaminopimelate ligase